MVAIDNSTSMQIHGLGSKALKSSLVLLHALLQLRINTTLAKLEQGLQVLLEANEAVPASRLQELAGRFAFDYGDSQSMNFSLARFMKEAIALMEEQGRADPLAEHICFILSDGRFNKQLVRDYALAA
jgi:hypothetical protein